MEIEPAPIEEAVLEEVDELARTSARSGSGDLGLVLDVPVDLAVEVGRTRMTIRETLALAPGAIVTLDRMAGEPVDLLVNGRRIARGEVVAIDEEFGFRITELTGPGNRTSLQAAPGPAAV